jgi:hypothetical protein
MAMSKPNGPSVPTHIKCDLCWKGPVPPHRHVKSSGIPKTKEELLTGLLAIPQVTLTRETLMTLNVKELKHLFRTHRGFNAHPACPCTRLSQLRVAELQTMCAQHNLITSPATRSGEMQLMLRMHWEEQCQLAEGVLLQQMTPAVTPSTATTKPTAPPGLSPMMEPVNVPVPMGKSSKRSSQEEDNWDVLSDVEGGNEEVMRQIREAEAAAQEALTRAATLRDAHCLPPKNRVAPMPKAKIPPAHSR